MLRSLPTSIETLSAERGSRLCQSRYLFSRLWRLSTCCKPPGQDRTWSSIKQAIQHVCSHGDLQLKRNEPLRVVHLSHKRWKLRLTTCLTVEPGLHAAIEWILIRGGKGACREGVREQESRVRNLPVGRVARGR